MKVSYLITLGTLCVALNSVEVHAKASIEALARENIHAIKVDRYGDCPANHYPSRYLDKTYGTNCYQCLPGTTWHDDTHKCF